MMARSKSIPGSKASRSTAADAGSGNKEQIESGNPVAAPDLRAVGEQTGPAQVSSETKVTPDVKGALEPRKMEVVKNDSRKNVVPINLDDEIRRRAYELYQQRGTGSGSEAEDWLAAEREVRQRYRQQSA